MLWAAISTTPRRATKKPTTPNKAISKKIATPIGNAKFEDIPAGTEYWQLKYLKQTGSS